MRYYKDQGFSQTDAQKKMQEFNQAKKLAETVKAYETEQASKVNPFNPMDEFQKFLDSKDDTYWKGVEATAKAKVDPYYDSMKSNLAQQLGIDLGQLNLKKEQNETNYNQDVAEIDRMTSYSKDEFARNMAKSDRGFASTIQQASEAYGNRGLLNSGVQAYGNLMSAKDQQANKESMQAGMDKTLSDLEASRKKAFSQYDLTKRSLGLTEQDTLLGDKQKQDKLTRDRATELEVARANADARITENALGDISKYTQQAGAIPTATATLSSAKTLAKKANTPKKFTTPLLN